MIEQVPTASKVTEDPETVQTGRVLLVYETGNPDVAVAVNVTGPAVNAVFGGCGNVITFEFDVTAKLLDTGVAAA